MGSDIFSRKCGAHNIIVPQHRSCPVCVSAKRSQLHAANMAHMPRYLFEQTLDVQADATGMPKPVRTFMKAPEQAKSCEVRWKVNFKSNDMSQAYHKLSSTTQALLMALDVTTDARLLKMRRDYQAMINSATSPSEKDRMEYNLAIDMYHEVARVSKGRIEDPERVKGQFVGYFRLLYGNGQRLIVDEPASKPAKYVLNFTSLRDSSNLNATTQELLRKLDKYEGDVGKYRIYHEKLIADSTSEDIRQRAVKVMAEDLWAVLPIDTRTRNLMKIRDQFLSSVEHLYFLGQRLTEVQDVVPTQPARRRSYADDVYDYLTTSSKTLYDRQRLVEISLGALRPQTRASLIPLFKELARDACDFYTLNRMPNYNALDTGHVYTLQTILADAYLEGKRR